MKATPLLLALLISSCTAGPMYRKVAMVDETGKVIGATTTIAMGGTFMAKRKGAVTQLKEGKGGVTIAYMTDSESSEGVPMAAIAGVASVAASSDTASVNRAKEATAQHAATQQTAQHAATTTAKTAVTTEAIKAGTPVAVAPITPP